MAWWEWLVCAGSALLALGGMVTLYCNPRGYPHGNRFWERKRKRKD